MYSNQYHAICTKLSFSQRFPFSWAAIISNFVYILQRSKLEQEVWGPLPHAQALLPVSTQIHGGKSVTVGETRLANPYHPQSVVHIRVHAIKPLKHLSRSIMYTVFITQSGICFA